MVKKLFRHELASHLRVLIPTYLLLMIFACGYRVIQMFDSETLVYTIILNVSRAVYGLSVVAMTIFAGILPIVRFYKNLFTTEGYLTFTLPVSPTAHLWVKLAGALLVNVMTIVAAAVSWLIVTAGDFFTEFVKAVAYMASDIPKELVPSVTANVIEIIILAIFGVAYTYLVYYLCISLGQLFKKNRIIAAVAIYFGYSMLGQIISTVLSIVMTFTGASFFNVIAEFFTTYPTSAAHLIFGVGILITAALSTAIFFGVRYIMAHKLNLE